MQLNFNFNGKTKLKEWWTIVRDNFQTIQNEHNAEVTARETHEGLQGSKTKHGHIKLSDSYIINGGVNDGIAATPNAVSSAYNSAIEASKNNAKSYDIEEAAERTRRRMYYRKSFGLKRLKRT